MITKIHLCTFSSVGDISSPLQVSKKALLRLWFHNHFGVTVTVDDKSYIQILSPEENTHIWKSL